MSSHIVFRSLASSLLGFLTAMLRAWFEPVSTSLRLWARRMPSGSTDRKSGQNCRTWPSGTYTVHIHSCKVANSYIHWTQAHKPLLQFRGHLSKGQMEELTPAQVASLPKTTVISRLRFIPKTDGMRPITRVIGADAKTRVRFDQTSPLRIKQHVFKMHLFLCSSTNAVSETCWIFCGLVCTPPHPSWAPQCGG